MKLPDRVSRDGQVSIVEMELSIQTLDVGRGDSGAQSRARKFRCLVSGEEEENVVVGSNSGVRPLSEIVDPSWATALAPVSERIAAMGDFLREENAAGRGYLPAGENVLRAFRRPMDKVRVLVVGQDPYPTPGHAMGLSFSVAPDVTPFPRSLANIFTEYRADLGFPTPTTGDLSTWADRGVLLLNRVLTVQPGKPGSHRRKGWEEVTGAAISALQARGGSLVAILWGRDAQAVQDMLDGVPMIKSTHPSPMSAHRGFFGSRPFSRANKELERLGGQPIDWQLP